MPLPPGFIVVDGYVPTAADDTNLRDEVWDFALDQRCFGPRLLLVAFADADGTFRGLSFTKRLLVPEDALDACIQHLGVGSAAAVAYCDEPVLEGPPPDDTAERFAHARAVARWHGIHLVDWIACDDDRFRSFRLALEPGGEYWDVQ